MYDGEKNSQKPSPKKQKRQQLKPDVLLECVNSDLFFFDGKTQNI